MTFFNSKEEVIDIQLTSYGKLLLSKGKFKPAYYSFHDDEIIYDSEYSNITDEIQKNIQNRIQKETPYLKTLSSFTSVETKIAENIVGEQDYNDRNIAVGSPLGTISLSSNEAPAWRIITLAGKELDSASIISGSTISREYITQFSGTIEYKTSVSSLDIEDNPAEIEPELNSGVFADGTFIKVEPETYLVSFEELNTDNKIENFDIEVYLIENETLTTGSTKTTREIMRPLSFIKKTPDIINGVLQDIENNNFEITEKNVEYYFDIFVDNEIDKSILCSKVKKYSKSKIFDNVNIKCPEFFDEPIIPNIYRDSLINNRSFTEEEADIEDC